MTEKKKLLNKDILIFIVMLALATFVVIFLFLYIIFENDHVQHRKVSDYTVQDDSSLLYEIESPLTLSDDGYSYVRGWLVKDDAVYQYYNYGADIYGYGTYNKMHFCVIEGDECYILPTKLRTRDDLELFEDGRNIGNCGFKARVRGSFDENKISYGMLMENPDGEEVLYVISKETK